MQSQVDNASNRNRYVNKKTTNTPTPTPTPTPTNTPKSGLSNIKLRSTSDDEYNNIIQKQKDEVLRILNSHDDTRVNESSFDPTKSSPPNDFMRKLQNRVYKFSS